MVTNLLLCLFACYILYVCLQEGCAPVDMSKTLVEYGQPHITAIVVMQLQQQQEELEQGLGGGMNAEGKNKEVVADSLAMTVDLSR